MTSHARPRSLVLLPGLACDAELWAGLLPALASRHRVFVSDVHTRFDTLPAMAAALLDELPPGQHLLAGCSMGGMVALHATLQAPERIAALALLGTSARADTPELVALRRQACVLFEQGRVAEVLQANVALAFHPRNAADAAQVQAYLALVERAGAAQLVRQNQAVLARPDLRPRLAAITCPTLVLVGEADMLTPPEHAREIAAAIPSAVLDTVAGAGHMLTLEQPAAVARRLLAWMAALP